MPKETIRSYFGLATPRHRRSHGSKTLKIVSATAGIVVILGIVFTLIHRSSNSPSASGTTTTTTPTTSVPSTTSPKTSATTKRSTTTTMQNTPSSTTTTTVASTTTTTTLTTAATLDPGDVLVQVINGSGATGQAGTTADALHADGFMINGTGDAQSFSYTESVITYSPGSLAAAQTLQRYIGGASTVKRSSAVPPSEVQLTTGSDFTGVSNS